MAALKASELIINSDGSIFHLGLKPEQLADKVLLVGDPGRVDLVSAFLSDIEFSIQNREFRSITGQYQGRRITVLSTGIGTDNIDIVVQELDALANIDLTKRELQPSRRVLELIRIGTSGTIQADIPTGSYVATVYSFGLDGLLYYYRDFGKVAEHRMMKAFYERLPWPDRLPKPYIVRASETLLNRLSPDVITGMTLSAHGFYGPQGRQLRLETAEPGLNDRLTDFRYEDYRITNYEMESSALYGLSRMLGHEALTVCLIVANRMRAEFLDNYSESMSGLIRWVLDNVIVPGHER